MTEPEQPTQLRTSAPARAVGVGAAGRPLDGSPWVRPKPRRDTHDRALLSHGGEL